MLSSRESKFVKSLKVKKYRVREERFLVEGAKNVQELLKSDFQIDFLVGTDEYFKSNSFLIKKIDAKVVSEKMLTDLGTLKSNNTCLAVARSKAFLTKDIDFSRQIFVLDGVNDPGNLGTIIRTMDWFGYDQLVCSSNSAELYNSKTINSTMGSFTRVKVYYTELTSFVKSQSLPVYGASMQGSDLYKTPINQPSIVLLGSESHGISEPLIPLVDQMISIPKWGGAESLNVGVAASIIASHLRNV